MPNIRRHSTYETTSVAGENVRAFIPPPLPPVPALDINPVLQDLIERANRGLGRLDGVTRILPDSSLFLYTYVRKEALLSSQIEGTQSSFSDLLLFEAVSELILQSQSRFLLRTTATGTHRRRLGSMAGFLSSRRH
jgi:hypothetical protein